MPKKIIFAIVAMTLVSLTVSQLSCSDKAILDSNRRLIHDTGSDVKRVYNGPASCATLKLDNGGYRCCYIKIKFKNEDLDEKFTHKGCYEITDSDSAKYVMGDSDDFDFKDVHSFSIMTRGYCSGWFEIKTSIDGETLGKIQVSNTNFWQEFTTEVRIPDGVSALYLEYKGGGNASLLSFTVG